MNAVTVGGIVLSLSTFAVYLWTLCPTVYVGDAGELIAAAFTLGSPHPPGYPVFCLVNKVLTILIPFGSIAFRMNLGSTLAAVGTVWLVYRCILTWGKWLGMTLSQPMVMAALGAGGLLACSELLWSQALDAEIYAFNSLAILGWLASLAWWMNDPQKVGRLFFCTAWYGMCLVVHQLTFLSAPIFLWAIWRATPRQAWSTMTWMALGLCFASGAILYLYLPLRSLAEPAINWGHPDTIDRFLDHIRRRQYGRLAKQERSITLVFDQMAFLVEKIWRQFPSWSFPLMGWGAWSIRKRWSGFPTALSLQAAAVTIGFALLTNFPNTAASSMAVSVFFAPAYVVAGLWLGLGCLALVRRAGSFRWGWIAGLLVMGPWYGTALQWDALDLHWHKISHDYGVALMASVPKQSTLIASGDNAMFSLAYLQLVEHRRTDLEVYDDSGYIFPNIYGLDFLKRDSVNQEFHRLASQRVLIQRGDFPVFYTLENTKHDMTGVRLAPSGLVQRASLEGIEPSSSPINLMFPYGELWRRYYISAAYDPRLTKGDYITRNLMAQFFYQMAGFLHDHRLTLVAQRMYHRSDVVGYDNEWIQSNLGVILMNRGQHEEAVARCRQAVNINPQSGEAFLNLGAALDAFAESLRSSAPEKTIRLEREARTAYERAIQLKPTYHTAYFNLGNTYMSQGRLREAIEQYQKALTHNPRSAEAHINLGNALDGWGDHIKDAAEKRRAKEAAMEEYRRALMIRPESVEAYINLGTAYFNRGNHQAAREAYEQALRFDASSIEARFNLANVALMEGKIEEAVISYRRVLDLNPQYIEAYFAMGVAHEKSGRKDEAVQWWRRGAKIDPHHAKIHAKLRQL